MAKYTASVNLFIDVFEAEDDVEAGRIVSDYVSDLANMMEDAALSFDLAWDSTDFFVYKQDDEEDE